jgi:hypothetical protein
MILPPAIAQKAEALAATSEELLPGFSPLERAAIVALKGMMKNQKVASTNEA